MEIRILDETPGKKPESAMVLFVSDLRITARQLIPARVALELEQPELCLSQFGLRCQDTPPKGEPLAKVDDAIAVALRAFEHGDFFLLASERQVATLDEAISLADTATGTFVKLTPLQGA